MERVVYRFFVRHFSMRNLTQRAPQILVVVHSDKGHNSRHCYYAFGKYCTLMKATIHAIVHYLFGKQSENLKKRIFSRYAKLLINPVHLVVIYYVIS